MNSKRGSSSVFLSVIFAALIAIVLALVYGAREESVRSRADAVLNLAGDSVMSEYNSDVQKEYGLFMLNGSDRELSSKLRRYAEYSLQDMKDVEIEKITVSTGRFSAADTGLIKDQIIEYMKLAAAEDSFNQRKDDTENGNAVNSMEYRTLRHGPTAVSLPSVAVPDKSLTAMAEGLTERVKEMDKVFRDGSESYMINMYILSHFNNRAEAVNTDHFFRNEAEYILAGEASDIKNEKRVEMALKAMRFPLNIAHIYQDPEKRAATLAMAEVMTPGALAPATQAALCATWAYAESDNDVELLWQGYKVPMIKDKASWATYLENAVEGITGDAILPEKEEGYDYGQYLQILMFFQDENIKISRILDLIQINIRKSYDGEFLVNECGAGIYIEAVINGRNYGYEKKY